MTRKKTTSPSQTRVRTNAARREQETIQRRTKKQEGSVQTRQNGDGDSDVRAVRHLPMQTAKVRFIRLSAAAAVSRADGASRAIADQSKDTNVVNAIAPDTGPSLTNLAILLTQTARLLDLVDLFVQRHRAVEAHGDLGQEPVHGYEQE